MLVLRLIASSGLFLMAGLFLMTGFAASSAQATGVNDLAAAIVKARKSQAGNPIEPAAAPIGKIDDGAPVGCSVTSETVRLREVMLCPVAPTSVLGASPTIDPIPHTQREVRIRILVESDLSEHAANFASRVALVLNRGTGWRRSNLRFVHVDRDYHLSVVLAKPTSVDKLCRPLQTRGWLSCAVWRRAIINSDRWLNGTETWGSNVQGYHDYLINHEVGHVLGLRHLTCPKPGALAPIMLPQTRLLEGCLANGTATPLDLLKLKRALTYFDRRFAPIGKRVRTRVSKRRRLRRGRRLSRRARARIARRARTVRRRRLSRRSRASRKARLSRRASLRRKRSRRKRRR